MINLKRKTGSRLEENQVCRSEGTAIEKNSTSLDSDSRRVLIWREPRIRYWLSNMVRKDHYGRGGLMVRTSIMDDEHSNHHVFNRGTLTSQRCRDKKEDLLAPYIKLFSR
ncbi:hypothetical protein TNCV_4678121 [Trichonephila clavipes]|nr:hypothetical protein TNCV_4678121 [Trichonephila clavipes]